MSDLPEDHSPGPGEFLFRVQMLEEEGEGRAWGLNQREVRIMIGTTPTRIRVPFFAPRFTLSIFQYDVE